MCFSAKASFTAATVLVVIGALLVRRTHDKRCLFLALIPFFFAVQQAAEGFLWLNRAPYISKWVFLSFAFVVWPLWIPFSFWYAEETPFRKQAMAFCLGIGLVVGFLLAMAIPHVQVAAVKHIQYIYSYRGLGLFYMLATLLPFFLSSLSKAWALGLLFLICALIVLWVERTFFISMWCFFSALISLGLLQVFSSSQQNH
jgi:hypothetical protein